MYLITCTRCGNQLKADDKFCTNCGAQTAPAAPYVPPPYAGYLPPSPQYTPHAQNTPYASQTQYTPPNPPYTPYAPHTQYTPQNTPYAPQPYASYTQPYAAYPPYIGYPPHAMSPIGPKPLSKGRAFWHGVIPVLIFVGLQIVATLATMLVFFISGFTSAFTGGFEDFFDILIYGDFTTLVLNGLLVSTILSIIIFSIMYYKQKKTFSITRSGSNAAIPITIIMAIAGSFMLITVLSIIQILMGTDLQTSGLELDDLGLGQLILSMLLVVILVPIAEEICFRGLSQNHFYKRFSFWAANCLQAGFFGLVHGVPIQVAYAFLIGLLIGWMYFKSGRLSIAIIAHMAFNSGGYILELIPNINDTFESIGLQMLYVFAPSLLVFAATFLLFARLTRSKSTA